MRLLFFLILTALSTTAFAQDESGGVLLFERGNWTAHLTWIKGPAVNGESVLRIQWEKQDHSTAPAPGKFDVALFMPDMGHGSYPPSLSGPMIDQNGGIYYLVNKMYFMMSGVWDVRLTLTEGSSKEAQALELTIP